MPTCQWEMSDDSPFRRSAACRSPSIRLCAIDLGDFPFWGMLNLSAKGQPEKRGIEDNDSDCHRPADQRSQAAVGKLAHFAAIARKLDQGNHGKRQLEAQNHLAQDQESRDVAF